MRVKECLKPHTICCLRPSVSPSGLNVTREAGPGRVTSLEASGVGGLALSSGLRKEQKLDFSYDLNYYFPSVCARTASYLVLDFICLRFLKLRKGHVTAAWNHYIVTSATVKLRKIFCKINLMVSHKKGNVYRVFDSFLQVVIGIIILRQ